MATTNMEIGKPLSFPTTTGSSFDLELRSVLWTRVLRVAWIGLGISLIATVVHEFLLEIRPPVVIPELAHLQEIMPYGYVASFAVALILLWLTKSWLCHLKLMIFTFLLLSFNLALALFHHGICQPGQHPQFEVALLLFLPAALIPWRSGFQLGLGITALVLYAVKEIVLFGYPAYTEYWSTHGSLAAYIDYNIIGVTSFAILGAVSFAASKTLYSMRKTVHMVKRLGNYEIEKELGHGGMGTVYLARHALICRPTAVKVLKAADGAASEALARFEQEVKLSANLTHPNTINIYDYGRAGADLFYYAMEYLDGMDLQQLVERFGPLPTGRVLHIFEQVCGSLSEAHRRGIIHRDIKPSNVFLTERGGIFDFAKVLDFGLARRVEARDGPDLTQTGLILGTPRYVAPETIGADHGHDVRSDIYNLGGVAYWLLTGEPLFGSSSGMELIVAHLKQMPLPPDEISENPVPKALSDIVMKCLQKDPRQRFQSVDALLAALRQVPSAEPWTQQKARDWWDLHGLLSERIAVCPETGQPSAL